MRRTSLGVLLFLLIAGSIPAVSGSAQAIQPAVSSAPVGLQADFNNDGADDLAVGIPTETVGSVRQAGAVNVLYGQAGGLTGAGSQLFTQDTPGVAGGAEPGDQFGFALAAGDFNNNGITDLAIGANLEDAGATVDAGAVTVLYGSPNGLTGTGSRLFTQVAGAVEAGDRFASALAAGDFNNDGIVDLAAGAPLEDVGTATDAGAVSQIRGSTSGLTTTGGQIHTERSFTGPQAGDQFGFALASGAFNSNDSFADLAIGVPGEDVPAPPVTIPDVGAVGIFAGTVQGLFSTFEDQHSQAGANERGDRFGSALTTGDFNNDGAAEVAAAAPLEDVGTKVDAGAASVFSDVLFALETEVFTQDTAGVAGTAEPGDRFGGALATG
jgi:hypothetical protein